MEKKKAYPTGVESHGGFLRIWFIFNGKRRRESLGIPDTPRNRKAAGEMRQAVCFAIRSGTFDYAKQFPQSAAVSEGKGASKDLTVAELFSRYLSIKVPELSLNTHRRYQVKLETCSQIIGKNRLARTLTQEDLLLLRNELLTGLQRPRRNRKTVTKGRSVATVNDYLTCTKGAIKFGYDNGYIDADPGIAVNKLKRSKVRPDPLSQDEFARLIAACRNEQSVNLWTLAVYTGLRHGEIAALAWEDIDLQAGTLTVRRNWTSVKQYTLPKTQAGTDRVIFLMQPVLDALKRQQALTRLMPQITVDVMLREVGKRREDACTFVFKPGINSHGIVGDRYTVTSISDNWDKALKRAKLRHRKAYQSRHTFACWSLSAGANPAFIATQMGHTSAQMLFNVYGDWIPDHNTDQLALLNSKLSKNAPYMPHNKSGTS
ncbi:integrase [Serratia fonticola]|nr:integrase [Serratia fonticola]